MLSVQFCVSVTKDASRINLFCSNGVWTKLLSFFLSKSPLLPENPLLSFSSSQWYRAFIQLGFVSYLLAVTATIRYKRAVEDGCNDENGKHYSVGEQWRMDFGSCQCYEDGSIGCVGIPLTAAPRTLIPFPIRVKQSHPHQNVPITSIHTVSYCVHE